MKTQIKNDPFFRPKDIEKKEKYFMEKRIILKEKLKAGLNKIESSYKKNKLVSEREKLFLKIFRNCKVSEPVDPELNGYFLKENDKKICFIDGYEEFVEFSIAYVYAIITRKFVNDDLEQIFALLKYMMKKYFGLKNNELNLFIISFHDIDSLSQ